MPLAHRLKCRFSRAISQSVAGIGMIVIVMSIVQFAYPGAAVGKESGFVEFRARTSRGVGHTYVAYGTITDTGKIQYRGTAGLFPTEVNPLLFLFYVPGYVGAERYDREFPISMRYRRRLSTEDYANFLMSLKLLRARIHAWHLFFFNCNDFAALMAQSLGLRTPATFALPQHFVRDLYMLNEPAQRTTGALRGEFAPGVGSE